jgi:Histidine kinase-, DNA gyrase B-, and HSP90-like ATPase
MKINLSKAISTFYPNPSYEQVYFEAVANALDADADEISIEIKIDAFDEPDTLTLSIKDNGKGFTDKSFEKFSRLLEVETTDHKGLGRLVYLAYFDQVKIESFYKGSKKREFLFNSQFSGESDEAEESRASGSNLFFDKYLKDRIYTYDYLIPSKIIERLVQHFFPRFFNKKENNEKLCIDISLEVIHPSTENFFVSGKSVFTLDQLPELRKTTFQESSLDLFKNFEIYYSVENSLERERSIYAAVCVDNRAIEYDLISLEAIPHGYQLRFLFVSDYFEGKTNSSRQKLELPDEITKSTLKEKLRAEIGNIIEQEIPKIKAENRDINEYLNNHYPHLIGYFPTQSPGLVLKVAALEEAQKRFFNDQRKILECEHLDDAQYKKALELSSRTLAEYVMYRMHIISKLKSMNSQNSEKDLHQLIVPMRKTMTEDEFDEDIYNNNVWILDDRFMSYSTILSDKKMEEIIRKIVDDDISDEGKPDITMVFSGDPNIEERVSVVIVELKKYGLKLAKKEEVISQLRQRARKLLKYFPDKIERIWFYGISEIDSEFRVSLLEEGFKELFSCGKMFFKPQNIIVEDESNPFIVDLFIMTYESLIKDAESRNNAFLRILKGAIRNSSNSS